MNLETNLIALWQEIQERKYEIGKSIAFIVERPVKREIFAGNFRDRIVHHLVINQLNPILEKKFIYDSYSCRVDKGTLFGIRRVEKFMRQATDNYTQDAYILKLDIAGFFMNINKNILFSSVSEIICQDVIEQDQDLLLYLCEKIIFNNPKANCIIKGKGEDWLGLPKSKSLFFSDFDTGLPIGNLTSQVFANLYLHTLDTFIKKSLKIWYYGRYVDDFILIHHDCEYLKWAISAIRSFLSEHLKLSLHPRKIYLQYFSKGVSFLGALIKPYRIYVGKRIKTNFYRAIGAINRMITEDARILQNRVKQKQILSTLNSYLGLIQHFDALTLRKKLLLTINSLFWNYFYISGKYQVIVARTRNFRLGFG